MITVLLTDNHTFIRNALRSLLQAADDIQVVAMASNGKEAVAQAILACPHVAVMDGIEATELIRECCRLPRMILLSGFDTPEYVQHALEVSAQGYVLKDAAGKDLPKAIHAIQRESHYLSEKITKIAARYLAGKGNHSSAV